MRELSVVLCVALCVGVVVSTPVDPAEGEKSPVATPAEVSPAEDTPAEPQAVEETPVEDDASDPRPKRWYPYYGGWSQMPWGPFHGPGYGYRTSAFPMDMVSSGSFVEPAVAGPTGRTRFGPGDNAPGFRTSASLNELLDHNRRQEHMWQHQEWQRDQFMRERQQNFPDVIDTATFNNNNFPNNFRNNMPNNFQNTPAVIDTQGPQSRTRGGPDMFVAPSGPMPAYAFDPNYHMHPNMQGFAGPYPFPNFR